MSAAPSLLDKTLRQFKRAWRLTSVAHKDDDIKSQVAPGLPESDLPVVRSQVDACLESRGGEVSARARACLLYTSPSPRDQRGSRMPSSA